MSVNLNFVLDRVLNRTNNHQWVVGLQRYRIFQDGKSARRREIFKSLSIQRRVRIDWIKTYTSQSLSLFLFLSVIVCMKISFRVRRHLTLCECNTAIQPREPLRRIFAVSNIRNLLHTRVCCQFRVIEHIAREYNSDLQLMPNACLDVYTSLPPPETFSTGLFAPPPPLPRKD